MPVKFCITSDLSKGNNNISTADVKFHAEVNGVVYTARSNAPYYAMGVHKVSAVSRGVFDWVVTTIRHINFEGKKWDINEDVKMFRIEDQTDEAFEYAENLFSNFTMADVWGIYDEKKKAHVFKGMVVARGVGKVSSGFSQKDRELCLKDYPEVCPAFGDILPYKSVTVICHASQENEVASLLNYVHGGGTVFRRARK